MRTNTLALLCALAFLVAGAAATAGPPAPARRPTVGGGLDHRVGRIDDIDRAKRILVVHDMGYRLDPSTAVRRHDGSLVPRSTLERGMQVRLRIRRTPRQTYPFLLDEVVIVGGESESHR